MFDFHLLEKLIFFPPIIVGQMVKKYNVNRLKSSSLMKKESEVTNVLIYLVLPIVPLFSVFWEA